MTKERLFWLEGKKQRDLAVILLNPTRSRCLSEIIDQRNDEIGEGFGGTRQIPVSPTYWPKEAADLMQCHSR